jgi:hypothetical protein
MEKKWETGIKIDLKMLFLSGTYMCHICPTGHERVKAEKKKHLSNGESTF